MLSLVSGFSNWLEAMENMHLKCIIIDQCENIKIAIQELMPNTIHHYYLWYIMSMTSAKFRGIGDQFDRGVKEFNSLFMNL